MITATDLEVRAGAPVVGGDVAQLDGRARALRSAGTHVCRLAGRGHRDLQSGGERLAEKPGFEPGKEFDTP